MGAVIDVAGAGLALAARYNPIAGILGATAFAALLADRRGARERRTYAVAALLAAWLLGDGLRVLARSRDLVDGAGTLLPAGSATWAQWATIALWAVGGFALGYLIPAWAGWFAGRRMTAGSAWAVAATVAVGVSLALAGLVAVLVT